MLMILLHVLVGGLGLAIGLITTNRFRYLVSQVIVRIVAHMVAKELGINTPRIVLAKYMEDDDTTTLGHYGVGTRTVHIYYKAINTHNKNLFKYIKVLISTTAHEMRHVYQAVTYGTKFMVHMYSTTEYQDNALEHDAEAYAMDYLDRLLAIPKAMRKAV